MALVTPVTRGDRLKSPMVQDCSQDPHDKEKCLDEEVKWSIYPWFVEKISSNWVDQSCWCFRFDYNALTCEKSANPTCHFTFMGKSLMDDENPQGGVTQSSTNWVCEKLLRCWCAHWIFISTLGQNQTWNVLDEKKTINHPHCRPIFLPISLRRVLEITPMTWGLATAITGRYHNSLVCRSRHPPEMEWLKIYSTGPICEGMKIHSPILHNSLEHQTGSGQSGGMLHDLLMI